MSKQLSPKQEKAAEKIMPILNKMDIHDAVELWSYVGTALHEIIEANRNKLKESENKLLKKE